MCIRDRRYSATSNWSLAVAVRVVAPVAPVLACQVTSQVDVAWMGHLPAPPVRSFRERQWNLYPHGGCAFQSYPVGGGVPVPWHVNFAGGPAANVSPAVVGSPRDQSTDENTAITVTLIPPAVTVLVRGPGLSTHSQVHRFTASFVLSGPAPIVGGGTSSSLYAC